MSTLTEKDYCDLDTSHELWVMGLEPEAYYDGPFILLYEAQTWLRKEKGIHVVPELGLIHRNKNGITHYYRVLVKDMNNGIIITLDNDRDDFESYEEALSEGIKESIKILKKWE